MDNTINPGDYLADIFTAIFQGKDPETLLERFFKSNPVTLDSNALQTNLIDVFNSVGIPRDTATDTANVITSYLTASTRAVRGTLRPAIQKALSSIRDLVAKGTASGDPLELSDTIYFAYESALGKDRVSSKDVEAYIFSRENYDKLKGFAGKIVRDFMRGVGTKIKTTFKHEVTRLDWQVEDDGDVTFKGSLAKYPEIPISGRLQIREKGEGYVGVDISLTVFNDSHSDKEYIMVNHTTAEQFGDTLLDIIEDSIKY